MEGGDRKTVGEPTIEDLCNNNQEQKPKTLWKRVAPKIWDTLDKPADERRLLLKLDLSILGYSCMGYFMRTLDQTNISNAYVSGMKEDLHMHGNQYVLLTTFFTIGYCVFMIPAQLVITKVNKRWWLPMCELCWGVCVAGMAGAKNVQTLYALRFLVGVFESTAYCGCLYLMTQWYTIRELAKRVCIFESSIYLASMFSGYLQTGLLAHMDGRDGLSAWRWLFIFDFILTLFTVIVGLCVIPNNPLDPRAWYLTKAERDLALLRLRNEPNVPETRLNWRLLGRVFWDPKMYILSVGYICQICGVRLYSYFNLWLKALGYSKYQVNTIPTAGAAIELVLALVYGWTSDLMGMRAPVIVGGLIISMVAAIILSSIDLHRKSAALAGWFLLSAAPPENGMWQVWVSDLYMHSPEMKMLVLGIINAVSFAFVAWIPLVLYPSGNAPYYTYGYYIAILFFGVGIICALAVLWVQRREVSSGVVENLVMEGKQRAGLDQSSLYPDDDIAKEPKRTSLDLNVQASLAA